MVIVHARTGTARRLWALPGALLTLSRPGTLSVRGYKGVKMLGQTVVWTRAAPNLPKCK